MLEREFWAKVKDKLTKEGCQCTRIETGSTELGVPDVFVQGHGGDVWLELKSESVHIKGKEKVKVHWRKGQLAWALVYNKIHHNKCTYTIARFEDGVLIIPMTCTNILKIEENYVPISCGIVVEHKDWKTLDLASFILK